MQLTIAITSAGLEKSSTAPLGNGITRQVFVIVIAYNGNVFYRFFEYGCQVFIDFSWVPDAMIQIE